MAATRLPKALFGNPGPSLPHVVAAAFGGFVLGLAYVGVRRTPHLSTVSAVARVAGVCALCGYTAGGIADGRPLVSGILYASIGAVCAAVVTWKRGDL
jgi:hypothetical protein